MDIDVRGGGEELGPSHLLLPRLVFLGRIRTENGTHCHTFTIGFEVALADSGS